MCASPAATPPDPPEAERLLHHLWRYEAWLARLHWGGLLGCLLLSFLFPGMSPTGALLLAASVGLGNAGLTWLLEQEPQPGRLRVARSLATVIEWKTVLGIVALRAADPDANAPPLVFVPLFFASVRYGRPGLLIGTGAALLTLGALTAAQVWFLRVLDTSAGQSALIGRTLLVFGVGTALWAQQRWHRIGTTNTQDTTHSHKTILHEPGATRQTRQGASRELSEPPHLSHREAEVLKLLALEGTEEMTIPEIGHRLNIKGSSVTTYIARLGTKLGVPRGGRRAVVRAARQQRLLPPLREA